MAELPDSAPSVLRPDPQPWQTLESRVAFENRWAGIVVDKVQLPNGARYEYTRLRPAGVGVAVAAFTPDGHIVLEREYRHGVGEVIWQLPGGLVDEGEDVSVAGLRELLEETGYAPLSESPASIRRLGCVWDNPGLGPAESHVIGVWNVECVRDAKPDASEFISVHLCRGDWLQQAVRTGKIRERTTVAAVTFLMLNQLL